MQGAERRITPWPTKLTFVAVGTPVTRRPPHRSVRAELLHTAPTSDAWRRSAGWDEIYPTCHLTHTVQVAQLAGPALGPGRGRLPDVLLGRSPSLHALRRCLLTLVRALRRCRVGGGALARWPPSAAQTARAVFPHAAFTKMPTMKVQAKGLTQPDLPAHTRRTAALQATFSSPHSASACTHATRCDA